MKTYYKFAVSILLQVIISSSVLFYSGNAIASNPEFVSPTPCTGFVPGYVGQPMSFSVQAIDADPGPITLTVSGLPFRAQMTPSLPLSGNPVTSNFYWIPSLGQLGSYNVTYTVTDSSGNQAVCNVFIDFAVSPCQTTVAPVFIPPTPACGTVFNQVATVNISFTVATSKPDSGRVYLDADGLPAGATMTPLLPAFGNIVTSIFSWTPGIGQLGNHLVTFYSIDTCGHQTTCSMSFDVVSPVELNSFISNVNGNNVILNWTTSSEINDLRFEIERAGETRSDWIIAGIVQGNGTVNSFREYSFRDMGLNTGKYYYRLKQIDFNGNFEYFYLSNEVVIGIPGKFNLSQNYPNPFNPETKIGFQIPEDGNVRLFIYDNNGKLVLKLLNGSITSGYHTKIFNASNFPSGIYYYKFEYENNGSVSEKVMKMVILK